MSEEETTETRVRMKCVVAVGLKGQKLILATWTDKLLHDTKQSAHSGEIELGTRSAWDAELNVLDTAYPVDIGLEVPEHLGPGVYVWEGDNRYPDDTFARTGSLEDVFASWTGEWRTLSSDELGLLNAMGYLWEQDEKMTAEIRRIPGMQPQGCGS